MRKQPSPDLPELYYPQWHAILQIGERILNCPQSPTHAPLWPILGLSKKAAATTEAIAALASAQLWADALVLKRTLIEIEITIKWFLDQDTENRIQRYVSGIDHESMNLLNKMSAGRSVSAQFLADLINPAALAPSNPVEEIGRSWSGLSIRDMSRDCDMERIYDMAYWISSAFVHSHVLSILDYNPSLKEQQEILGPLFGRGSDDFPCWLVLGATPSQALHIFMAADRVLHLGLSQEIESSWELVRQCLRKASGGSFAFSDDVREGDLIVRGHVEGKSFEKRYSPRRMSAGRPKKSPHHQNKRSQTE